MWFSSKQHSLLGNFLLAGAIVALVLAVAVTAQAQTTSIAVHLDAYNGGNSLSNAGSGSPGGAWPAAIVPAATPDGLQFADGSYNTNWTNAQPGWYSDANNTNLKDNTGAATTCAVYTTVANGSYGTYWYDGGYSSTDPVLNGPWGNNGAPIPLVLTGIPYASYQIIGYTNPPYGAPQGGLGYNVWLDSSPGTANSANAPVPGSEYYFWPDSGTGSGLGYGGNFDLMTNTNNANFPGQNTVVYGSPSSPLTGATQTLWAGDMGITGANNFGFIGVEIVDLSTGSAIVPEPSTLALLGVAAIGLLAWRKRRAA